MENFFDNLLPDSSLIRSQLQSRLGIDTKEPIALLERIGSDCLGALQLLPPDIAGFQPARIDGVPLSEAEIGKLLRRLPRYPMGIAKDSELRLSLAGNHEKTALLRHGNQWLMPIGATPTTHILKLPIGVTNDGFDLRFSVENEWLCHRIASLYGLPVAAAEIATFKKEKALVVTRFDRSLSQDEKAILRLPHEDLCQATGTPSAFKYESEGGPGIRTCMKLLAGSHQAEDKETFFKAQVIFWLLCAIDGHAKNFSLSILPLGRFRLAPLYDILSAYPILGHGKGKLPRQEAAMAMCRYLTMNIQIG